MTEELDPVLRTRLDRLARAVPVAPERLRPIATASPRYRGRSGLGVLAAAVLILVLALATASMGGGRNPNENLASPSPGQASPAQPSLVPVVQLPTWPEPPDNGLCPAALMRGTLRGDPERQSRPVWVETNMGLERTVVWPYGFSARFDPDLELLDAEGEVVARQGDVLDLGGGVVQGLPSGFDFYACRVRRASSPPDQEWGPLAVLPRQDGMDMARNEGTLRITDSCVYLEWAGERTLLLWHEGQPTWNEASRSITFDNFDGIVVTLRDGDRIEVGGSGGGSDESGETGEEFVKRMKWVAPPAPSCSVDPWFGVGAVAQLAWGPLAVAREDAQNDLDAGTGPGRLVVGDRCVTLLQDTGAELTLIWRSAQTGWDPDPREILFDDRNLGVIRLADGERLSLGGAGLADPASPDQGAPQPEWMALPDPSCPDARWVVHQVYLLDQ